MIGSRYKSRSLTIEKLFIKITTLCLILLTEKPNGKTNHITLAEVKDVYIDKCIHQSYHILPSFLPTIPFSSPCVCVIPFIYSSAHQPFISYFHSFVHLFLDPSIHPLSINQGNLSIQPSDNPFLKLPYIHPSTKPCIRRPLGNPAIQPSLHPPIKWSFPPPTSLSLCVSSCLSPCPSGPLYTAPPPPATWGGSGNEKRESMGFVRGGKDVVK